MERPEQLNGEMLDLYSIKVKFYTKIYGIQGFDILSYSSTDEKGDKVQKMLKSVSLQTARLLLMSKLSLEVGKGTIDSNSLIKLVEKFKNKDDEMLM